MEGGRPQEAQHLAAMAVPQAQGPYVPQQGGGSVQCFCMLSSHCTALLFNAAIAFELHRFCVLPVIFCLPLAVAEEICLQSAIQIIKHAIQTGVPFPSSLDCKSTGAKRRE